MNRIKIAYYFFLTLIFSIFLFFVSISFFILINYLNLKLPDKFYLHKLQKKIYFFGSRNIWQYNENCSIIDDNLIYIPSLNPCRFKNIEFDTILNFDENGRIPEKKITNYQSSIVILGDSHAMGWGVNDNQTFASKLNNLIDSPVLNFGVSSYATEREIQRLINWKHKDLVDLIIIQYCENDLEENLNFPIKKEIAMNKYKSNKKSVSMNLFFKILRVYYNSIKDIFYKNQFFNIDINFNNSKKHKENILRILNNYQKYLEDKRIIIFYSNEWGKKFDKDWAEVIKYGNIKIEFVDLNFKTYHYFKIDDHLNELGHEYAANQLYKLINK